MMRHAAGRPVHAVADGKGGGLPPPPRPPQLAASPPPDDQTNGGGRACADGAACYGGRSWCLCSLARAGSRPGQARPGQVPARAAGRAKGSERGEAGARGRGVAFT